MSEKIERLAYHGPVGLEEVLSRLHLDGDFQNLQAYRSIYAYRRLLVGLVTCAENTRQESGEAWESWPGWLQRARRNRALGKAIKTRGEIRKPQGLTLSHLLYLILDQTRVVEIIQLLPESICFLPEALRWLANVINGKVGGEVRRGGLNMVVRGELEMEEEVKVFSGRKRGRDKQDTAANMTEKQAWAAFVGNEAEGIDKGQAGPVCKK